VQAVGPIARFVIAARARRARALKNLPVSAPPTTCMICDGYRTTGRKLPVIDRTINGGASAGRQMLLAT
jgi:hypothetical protein